MRTAMVSLPLIDRTYLDMEQTFCKVCAIEEIVRALPRPRRRPLPDPAKQIVIHADDLGMCHGANVAFVELVERGVCTCGSAMVPCPWFAEIARCRRATRASTSASTSP